MPILRRSISFHRDRQTKSDSRKDTDSATSHLATTPRSSVDTFIIRGRTRLPSDTIRKPEPFDVNLARHLLSLDGTNIEGGRTLSRSASQYFDSKADPKSGSLVRNHTNPNFHDENTPYGVPSVTQAFSSFRNSHDTVDHVSKPETSEYLEEFNRLAKLHGFEELDCTSQHDRFSEAGPTSSKSASKTWLKRNILRSGSPGARESPYALHLTRKSSIGSLFHRQSRSFLKQKPLEEMLRMGGVSLLPLPASYTAVVLMVPTCFAVTAKFLLDHARGSPGIFRIPGQASIVHKLHEHFLSQLEAAEKGLGQVQATVCTNKLPAGFSFSVHDIASTFKKLLSDLPGGILGSVQLFKTLQEIDSMKFSHQEYNPYRKDIFKAQLVALAILASATSQRVALISLVFGLLALLKHDEGFEPTVTLTLPKERLTGHESMSSEALGVVFAPLLIGEYIEYINVEACDDVASVFSDPSPPKRRWIEQFRTPKTVRSTKQKSEISKTMDRNKIACNVIELLIRNWTEIVRRMKALQSASRSSNLDPYSGKSSCNTSVKQRDSTINFFRRPYDEPLLRPKSRFIPRYATNSSPAVPSRSSSKVSNFNAASMMFNPNNLSRSTSLSVLSSHERLSSGKDKFRQKSNSTSQTRSQGSVASISTDTGSVLKRSGERCPTDCFTTAGDTAWWGSKSQRLKLGDEKPSPVSSALPIASSYSFDYDVNPGTTQVSEILNSVGSSNTLVHSDAQDHQKCANKSQFTESTVSSQMKPEAVESQDLRVVNPSIASSSSKATSNPFDSQNAPLFISSSSNVSTGSSVTSMYANEKDQKFDVEDHASDKPSIKTEWLNLSSPPCPDTVKKAPAKIESAIETTPCKSSPSKIPRLVVDTQMALKQPMLLTKRKSVAEIVAPLRQTSPNSKLASSPKTQMELSPISIGSNDSSHFDEATTQDAIPVPAHRKSTVASARRAGNLRVTEPPIARQIKFRNSQETTKAIDPTIDPFFSHTSSKLSVGAANVGTLYAEIARLKAELEIRGEENSQLKQQLDAMRNYKDSGTLSEQLRIAERNAKAWRARAEWAERNLLRGKVQDPKQANLDGASFTTTKERKQQP